MSKNLLHAALVGVVMTSGPAQSADLERADPASVGMSAAALANLKTKMNELVTSGDRAGLVYAVARDGKTVALEAIGLRSIENQLPMETDTQFRIYSMTRAISATAALSLLDDGALALEDNVERYIPEIGTMKVIDRSGETISTVDQASPMTVRHLFTYTAGLGYAPNWPAPYTFDQKTVLNPDVTIAEGVANLAKFPLLYQPGAKWHYGFSGDVLGRVAEVASGQPLDQLIKARVLDKIGMTGTGFWISPDDVKRNRLADVYARKEENGPLVNGNSNVPPLSHFTRPGKLFSGGGGLVSTVPDYLRFAQMLLNGGKIDGQRVLKSETVAAMVSQQTSDDQGSVYWYAPGQFTSVTGWMWGLSIGVRPDSAGEEVPGRPGEVGWSGLANTFFMVNLREKLVAVIMAQYVGPGGNDMSAVFRDSVYAAINDSAD